MEDIFFHISASEWAEIIRNYTLAVAAGVTAWVAFQGLNSWKKQKTWEFDRRLAREILIAKEALNDRIIRLRISASLEKTKDFIDKGEEDRSSTEAAKVEVFLEHFEEAREGFEEASAQFLSLLTEGATLWDNGLSAIRYEIDQLIDELAIAVSNHTLRLKYPSNQNMMHELKEDELRSLVKVSPTDAFAQELDKWFEELVFAVKPKLDTLR